MQVKKKIAFATLATVVALLLLVVAYAQILGTIRSGDIVVVTVPGDIALSQDGISWANAGEGLTQVPLEGSIFARVETTGGGYVGDVQVSWSLWQGAVQKDILPYSTPATLTASGGEVIHCSPTGQLVDLEDWGTYITVPDTYTILATFEVI